MSLEKTTQYTPQVPKQPAILILGQGSIRQIELKGRMDIGRKVPGSTKKIQIPSSIVSRDHGVFIYNELDEGYYYRDNNSLNGTYLNGIKISSRNENGSRAIKLVDGDILRIDCKKLDKPHKEATIMIYSTQFDLNQSWDIFELSGKQVQIGRNVRNGLRLDDFMVSQKHAEVFNIGNEWKIRDTNSTNGVFLNGDFIESDRTLNIFDVLRIGSTTLIYLGGSFLYNNVKKAKTGTKAARKASTSSVDVDIKDVTVLGGKKTLLKDIHLKLEGGDFVLIMGGAGAGKTTFIKSIIGEMRANGQIMLNGLDLYKNYGMLKDKIGIVPQFATVRMNDTVYNTLMDAAKIKLAGVYSKKEIKERVEDVMNQMMLQDIRNSMVGVISGGQKKRVEVAIRSVTEDQTMFILDEPDSGVDVAGRTDMMENLKACADSGSIVSVITHMPNDAQHLFTKVIVLAKSKKDGAGHLAFYGNVQQALDFFGVRTLQDIIIEINAEGGKGRADEFIEKYERTRL